MKYPTVFPALVYDDPSAAIDFLTTAFGAEQHAVYGEDGHDMGGQREMRVGEHL